MAAGCKPPSLWGGGYSSKLSIQSINQPINYYDNEKHN